MKKILLLMLVVLGLFHTSLFAKSDIVNHIKYDVIDNKNKSVKASLIFSSKGDVVLPERVKIGKIEYVVKEIGEVFFRKNKSITSVTIPSTVTKIGKRAFAGCPNIEKIVFPFGSYIIEKDAFVGCDKITTTDGNTFPYLEYLASGNSLSMKTSAPKFYNFAKDKLKALMEDWQTKKEYESIEQYMARVTEENRNLRMEEFKKDLEQEYANLYSPKHIQTMPVKYDREYEVYTIRTDLFGNIFAKVPKNDANSFRENYKDVIVTPHFGVKGDTLSILSCDFLLNGKSYASAKVYDNNGMLDPHFELPEFDIDKVIAEEKKKEKPTPKSIDRSIDKDIPITKTDNDKTFVLIIGNEKYKRIAEVPFANNDAKVFAEYCQKTLGIPQKNIDIYKDASVGDMRHAVQVLKERLEVFNGDARAIIYYSGHGYPDEATHMPYLMPIDGFASDISNTGYNLNDIYDELAEAPSQLTLVLLDACFSGTTRHGDMAVNAKGIAIAARSMVPTGNMMVFSASQGTETAYVDEEHGHGRFTYYLLKHLRETKGDTTLGGLVEYVTNEVKIASVTQKESKRQTPTPNPSFNLAENWKTMKLR